MLAPKFFLIAFIIFSISFLLLVATSVTELIYINVIAALSLLVLRIIIKKKIEFNFFYLIFVAHFYYLVRELFYFQDLYVEESFLISAKLLSYASITVMSLLFINPSPRGRLVCTESISMTNLQKKILWVGLLLFTALKFPVTIATLVSGRNYAYELYGGGGLYYFLDALSYLLPVGFAMMYRQGSVSKFTISMVACVVFLFIVLSGTRFVFLFSFIIFICLLIDFRKIKFTRVISLVMLLMFASASSIYLRSGSDSLESQPDLKGALNTSEHITYYLSGLVRYYDSHQHSYLPTYSIFWTYFYIPRQFWVDKPEMIGKWIVNSDVFSEAYTEQHSGAVSFVGPFYADFGIFVIFLPYFLALLLKRAEKSFFINHGALTESAIISAAMLPTIFFAYRSFNTSIINFIFIVVVFKTFFLLNRKFHK